MPDATQVQVKRILVLWLLLSTGNNIDKSTWDSQIKPKIDGAGQLPPGVTSDSLWNSAQDNAVALTRAIGSFKSYTAAPVNSLWGGGTSCPNWNTIMSMFP